MIRKNLILLSIERISLLINRKVSQQFAMQETHSRLLQDHFYLNLRLKFDSVLEDIRIKHDESLDIDIIAKITRKDITLASNQKLILRTLHSLNFKKAIVYSETFGATIWFPVDRKWQDQLSELGLRFNRPICCLLLRFFKIFSAIRSFLKLLRQEFRALRGTYAQTKELRKTGKDVSCIYLSGFIETNFPNLNFESHNFFDWFAKRIHGDTLFLHNCMNLKTSEQSRSHIHFQDTPVPKMFLKERLASYLTLTILILRYVFNPQLKVFELLSQVDEILVILQLSRSTEDWKYEFVIFPSTVLIAQPLWSIFLERSATKVILVNYTAMAEPLSPKSTRVVDGIWHLSTWNNTWVVDEYQSSQMKLTSRYTSKNFSSVGVPYWSGRTYDDPPRDKKGYLAVFDTHIRSNQVFSAGVVDEMGWNDPILEETFIEIVLDVAMRLNLVVLHKKKRKVPEIQQVRVDEITLRLKSEYGEYYQAVDESFSAASLIGLSVAVVSKPISTTAFVATEMGKPSIILDPTMNTQSNDPGLRDCKLAYTADQLFQIIKNSLDV